MRTTSWTSTLRAGVAATVLSAFAMQPALAQTVQLKSTDGTISVNGQLQSFEGGFYTIQTVLGTLRIASDNIICEGEACPDLSPSGDVVIAGSATLGSSLMPLLLSGFAGEVNGIAEEVEKTGPVTTTRLVGDSGFGDEIGTFTVSSTSSSDAFRELRDKGTNIGMSSRRIEPQEARSLRDRGAGNMIALDQEHVIAVDSILVVVNHDNPVDTLSMEQIDRIYAGQITNWSQVGGSNQPIVVYGRDEGSGTRSVFEARVFAASGRSTSNAVRVADDNESLAAAVASDANAIGYVGHAFVRGSKPVNIADTCGIVTSANSFAAKTEEYPLQRRLYLYNRADNATETVSNFIDYVQSAKADGVISKSGFINLGVERVTQDTSNDRMRLLIENTTDPFEFGLMRELLVDMFQWDRLSTTFRFASGSSQLDGKALLDLQRLAEYLKTQPDGTEVALVGFTDSDGAFDANRALSIGRAQQVADTIRAQVGGQLSNVRFSFKGFGELAPTACNTSLDGKRINRRVEVWIRKPS
ncbi:phosphate ABC transporter substrate-binding/OmpA family protein [Halovulum sp. GXIMD14793]